MALVYLCCLFPFWLLCCGDLVGVGFVLFCFFAFWFGLRFCVFVCKTSYVIFASTEVRLTSRWFSRFSFSFLMITFFLTLRLLWVAISDLSEIIETGSLLFSTFFFFPPIFKVPFLLLLLFCSSSYSVLSQNLLMCSGNVTRAYSSVLQQHPRQYNCSGRALLEAFLLLPQIANFLDLSFSAPILGVSIHLSFECNA